MSKFSLMDQSTNAIYVTTDDISGFLVLCMVLLLSPRRTLIHLLTTYKLILRDAITMASFNSQHKCELS